MQTCDETRFKNALQGKDGRSGGMNLPELIRCVRSKGMTVKSSVKRSELVADVTRKLTSQGGPIEVIIPETVTSVFKILPTLRREYGGIMDFKLNGSFEAMSMVPGESKSIKSEDVPDYEVWWHNHPETGTGFSIPSFNDITVLIKRKYTQYSLVFTQDGTFIQWVPDKDASLSKLKLFMDLSKSKDLNEMFLHVLFDKENPDTIKQYISGVRAYFAVETKFVPWGQPISMSIKPYEPSVHKGRSAPSIKVKRSVKWV